MSAFMKISSPRIAVSILVALSSVCQFKLFSQPSVSDFIHVDQFGYRPSASKVAVISDPQTGYDASQSFSPSTGANQYQLKRSDTDEVVFSGTLKTWNVGVTDVSSGNKAWWFDFSSVVTPGTYYVFDVGKNARSYTFDIREDVYEDVLRVAVRMFYYNRCNHEKLAEHAGENWTDGPSFVGANQDKGARSVTDPGNAATARDLSGGWWDAGDYNKYVTFARAPLHQLLDAYEQNPSIWGDNYKIPESGNGIADILDELKWELDWLKKMQLDNGSSLIKMGSLVNTDGQASLPPSQDTRPRYYYPNPCSSATITLASIFSHAALIFQTIPGFSSYADDLKQRAINAFIHFNANSKNDKCDDGSIQAGDADRSLLEQEQIAVQAAIYLFALTGETSYRDFVDTNYTKVKMMADTWWGPYDCDQGDALMYYTKVAGATTSVVNDILNKRTSYSQDTDLYKFNEKDPYRAHMKDYVWGSNMTRANISNINYDFITYGLDVANSNKYLQRAEEILHYFHGVNPFNMVYMTNMKTYGAEKSVNEIYHSWFKDNSVWDNAQGSAKGGPAPGYIPGGPNKSYKDGNNACLLSPPCNQPAQKSYKDWNGIWPDASWSVTEPAIYYQSAYIKALSRFAAKADHDLVLPPAKEIVTGAEKSDSDKSLDVYPIPGKDEINVKHKKNLSDVVQINIFDAQGVLVDQHRYHQFSGETTFDVSDLPPGVYFLSFESTHERIVKRILIL
jgi:endoglucanase